MPSPIWSRRARPRECRHRATMPSAVCVPYEIEGKGLRVYRVWEGLMQSGETIVDFETLRVRREGPVLFAEIAAPPMNLLGTELVRDLVSLIQRSDADETCQVLVFTSADADYFISHVDVTRMPEYRE